MKEKYIEAAVVEVEFLRRSSFLAALGSVTDTAISVPKENTSVVPFEDDKGFTEGGFGDVSF